MQSTLLAISVAIILALVTALVGPHFVDWSKHRAYFEGEATRLAGTPVRIAGPIDVRLLPTPTLSLGQIEIGSAAQPQAKAREVYAELALGSLMRGEVRAAELRVVGPEVALSLGPNGRAEWQAVRLAFDADKFVIDRVAIEDGRATFADAGSGSQAALEGFWFKGDLRSLIGPVKGEGGFISAGERVGYRISAGRIGDDGSVKLRIGLDPSDHPLAIEADGTLRFEDSAPRFEGTMTLVRPAATAGADGRGTPAVPWRATSRVKVAPTNALFEQLEYQYGPDASAIKLGGTADFRFGKNPRIDSVVSARQADLDRALALPEGSRRVPLAAIKAFIEQLTASYRPTIPVRLGIGIDALTLAGGTLQSVRGDLKLDGEGWDIETLDFRAPGFAQVRLSGRVAHTGEGISFKGPAQIESSDPKLFLAWLEGRSDTPQAQPGQLRASGDLILSTQEIAVEQLKFEFDRKAIEGRFSYLAAAGARPPRLNAEFKAAELDVDRVMAFGRAATEGTTIERPREVSLAVDVGRAIVAGIDVKGVRGTFRLDRDGVTIDRVRIADLADASFNLNGRMEGTLDAPRGTVTFDVDARGLDGTVAVLAKYFPQAADPVRQAAGKITPLKARATLGIEPVSSTEPGGASKVTLALDGSAGAMRMKFGVEASGDLAALTLPDFRLDGQVNAADGSALIALLGLDRALNVDKRAGTLTLVARSVNGGDARLEARLTAGGLTSAANGTARLFSAGDLAATLDLTLQASDAGPLRRGASAQAAPLPVALRAKLVAAGDDVTLDAISGVIAGSPVRGKLKFAIGAGKRIDGQLDTDAADVPALVALLSGMPKSAARDAAWPGDPFAESVPGDYSGRIALSAARATLTPTLIGRQVRGALRFGGGEIAIEDITATLAGGKATGQLILRRSPEGLALNTRFALAGGDAGAILPSEAKPVFAGRLAVQAELEGSGLSPASLIGSLSGSGMITLEDGQIASLDPKAFNAALRVLDQGVAIDAAKIRDIVATVLDGGTLAVPRLDAPFAVNAGQIRIGQTPVYAQGADLMLAARADIADGLLDARLTLSGPAVTEGANTTRPEILVMLKGPYAAPKRTIDVSALSAWLMLRSVERQSKHIDTIETERRETERREAERRDAERREFERKDAERRETERRDAERREAERKELERRSAEAASAPIVTAPVPTALPSPSIMEEEGAPTSRPQRPRTVTPRAPAQPIETAPPLPPPLNIGPAPGSKAGRPQRPATSAVPPGPPPPPPRSALDSLFGLQR